MVASVRIRYSRGKGDGGRERGGFWLAVIHATSAMSANGGLAPASTSALFWRRLRPLHRSVVPICSSLVPSSSCLHTVCTIWWAWRYQAGATRDGFSALDGVWHDAE